MRLAARLSIDHSLSVSRVLSLPCAYIVNQADNLVVRIITGSKGQMMNSTEERARVDFLFLSRSLSVRVPANRFEQSASARNCLDERQEQGGRSGGRQGIGLRFALISGPK